MKFKKIMIFCLIFVFLFSLSFSVVAQRLREDVAEGVERAEWMTSKMLEVLNNLFTSLTNLSIFEDYQEVIVFVAVSLILIILFSNVLINFSTLSKESAIAVSFLLVLILSVFRVTYQIVILMVSATAIFGAYSVLVALGLSFASYLILHKALYRLFKRFMKKKNVDDILAGMDVFKKAGEKLHGRRPGGGT